MNYYIGVDIGGTKTAVVLGNEAGEIFKRIHFETDHVGGPEAVLTSIKNAIFKLRAIQPDVAAVGVSCGGPLDADRGVVLGPPNLPGWDEVYVVKELNQTTGLPVYLENDANAGALAEWMYGAGRGCNNVIFITAGTGLGCGLIVDGRLYSGTNGMAGEAGHIRLAEYGPLGYGKYGSFEGFCSGAGIARFGQKMLFDAERKGIRSTLFRRRLAEPLTTKIIAEEAIAGDALAEEILATAGTWLGQGLSVLIDLFNPEVIVLGSLAVRLGERYLGPARQVIAQEALEPAAEVCQILPAELGEKIGDMAALCVAQRHNRI